MTPLQRLNSKWEKEKPLLKRKQEIDREKRQLTEEKTKLTTTKKYMVFIFASATIIELFTGYLMLMQFELAKRALELGQIYSPDMGPQVTLITTVISEVVAFAIYAVKALKEKSKNGIEYETAMRKLEKESCEEPEYPDCGVG